ncbi:MAG TPA: cysteine desulfurase [Anaerolineaceae bacterium]|uniref:Cysteine desulfurase n=1 Tax=Anaerolinea thermophila TaxID=167964 RepID=A0A101FZ11_9CHLR|nr:MAG: Cysteine desulfurase [Anaerolinea thermophila]HAF60808.1 cysteine desulfurase [Anaerolineaceae bacterium]
MFDVSTIRDDFPIFNRKIHGNKRLVYLDSAASSQKPQQVLDAMDRLYTHDYANIHRGIHELAEEATAQFEDARNRIADFIGVQDSTEIVFTRNTTESINLVAHAWGRKYLNPGDHILLTEMEHHSNLVPWYMLAQEKGLTIDFIPITADGLLNMDQFNILLNKQPKLVSFTHVSNVLGTINPVAEITALSHQAGAVVLVDGAQSVPHLPVDIEHLGVDFYAFSAHKMCGPTGIGILYGKRVLLEGMNPFLGGGDMIKKVTFEDFSVNEIPYKFEAGTSAIAEAIGFGAAVDYLNAIGMQAIHDHEKEVTKYAYEQLATIPGLQMMGPAADQRGGVISFELDDIHPHDIAQILDAQGIAVRAGHHCAMPLHQRLKVQASTRVSFYLYNTSEDVDDLVKGIYKVKEIFGRGDV